MEYLNPPQELRRRVDLCLGDEFAVEIPADPTLRQLTPDAVALVIRDRRYHNDYIVQECQGSELIDERVLRFSEHEVRSIHPLPYTLEDSEIMRWQQRFTPESAEPEETPRRIVRLFSKLLGLKPRQD